MGERSSNVAAATDEVLQTNGKRVSSTNEISRGEEGLPDNVAAAADQVLHDESPPPTNRISRGEEGLPDNVAAAADQVLHDELPPPTNRISRGEETADAEVLHHKSPHKKQCPWTNEELAKIIGELFPESLVHSSVTCSITCCGSVSKEEIARIQPKKFKHQWINKTNWWLVYVEKEGMYCLLCRKHHMRHPQNSREVFSSSPSVRFKVGAITTHANSNLHSSAFETDMIQKVSSFHQEVVQKSKVETKVLESCFSTAYFLMKQFIANRKFIPLLDFIQTTFNVDSLKYFDHRSDRVQQEIFLVLGEATKKSVVEEVQKSHSYGLLVDEVADVSVTENLITFIQYFSQDTKQVETKFLACQNILSSFDSANAEAISSLLLSEVNDSRLEVGKLTGFSSDGAPVMVGPRNGVAVRLKAASPIMINIHCICHRLSLSCTDSNDATDYIKTVETILRQLWQLFENSPKKMAKYLKIQTELKRITLNTESEKIVTRRLKKACRTRWLSFEASIKAVFLDFTAILHTLAELQEKDAAACGLLQKMRCLKFLGTVYILNDILPVLGDLSRLFQKGSINFSIITPAIKFTKVKLRNILEENKPIESLRLDIESMTDKFNIRMSKKDSDEIESLLAKYVRALEDNIDKRFSDCSEVLSSFSIFDPLAIPSAKDESFKEYGKKEMKILADHIYQVDNEEVKKTKTEKLLTQWQGLKYHIVDHLLPRLPSTIEHQTSTDWCLQQLLKNDGLHHFFGDVMFIADMIASLPVSNAWPERGASALKNVKTRLRNRLSEQMLDSILQVAINGPSPTTPLALKIIKSAVALWLGKKNRRKLTKTSTSKSDVLSSCEMPIHIPCMQDHEHDEDAYKKLHFMDNGDSDISEDED